MCFVSKLDTFYELHPCVVVGRSMVVTWACHHTRIRSISFMYYLFCQLNLKGSFLGISSVMGMLLGSLWNQFYYFNFRNVWNYIMKVNRRMLNGIYKIMFRQAYEYSADLDPEETHKPNIKVWHLKSESLIHCSCYIRLRKWKGWVKIPN